MSTNEPSQPAPDTAADTADPDTPESATPAQVAESIDPALTELPKHSFLLYTAARLGLLLVAAALLYLLGARSWLLLVLALLLSGMASLVLLGRLRDGISVKVATRVDAAKERRAAAAQAEDDLY